MNAIGDWGSESNPEVVFRVCVVRDMHAKLCASYPRYRCLAPDPCPAVAAPVVLGLAPVSRLVSRLVFRLVSRLVPGRYLAGVPADVPLGVPTDVPVGVPVGVPLGVPIKIVRAPKLEPARN